MKTASTLYCVALAAFLISCGNSDSKDTTSEADSVNEVIADRADDAGITSVDEDDSEFAVEAANGGMAEVELGELGLSKATDPQLKDFSRMVVTDHTKVNDELKALTTNKNIILPTGPDEQKRKIVQDLTAKSGRDFDKAFISEMVKDHKKDVKLFEDAQKKVKDPDIKAFVDKTLPVLKMHLENIQRIEKRK